MPYLLATTGQAIGTILLIGIGLIIIYNLLVSKKKKPKKIEDPNDPAEDIEPTDKWLHRKIMESDKAKEAFFGGPMTRSEKRSQ